jgi:hypothetical protein
VDFNNDEDQASNSKEVKWNDDGDGGYGDNSEVEIDSSDSSAKLSLKHIKKSNKNFRIAAVEDDDDRSESCKSDSSRFSQTSSIKLKGDPELLQFSGPSSLNSKESFSATAIDLSIKKHKRKKPKRRGSDQRQRYGNVGVQSLYHGIFTTFQCHNAYSYNSDKKALIISFLMNCKLVRTPPSISKNAEVSSWWKEFKE